ncbi:MAG: hypothetical protein NT085_01670 [candidate division SR1 bacterium]|nr:hypothetical protein [candidate division SR1 bacterium]
MKKTSFKSPNAKYWTPEDIQALKDAVMYTDLFVIALRIIDRMPQKNLTQICGPITTGGKGSKEANIKEFNKAIRFFISKGENIFDQMPFQDAMERLSKDVEGYDERILEHFYLPLFRSGKIKKFKFLPDWESSKGASWENEQLTTLNYNITYLLPNWHKTA